MTEIKLNTLDEYSFKMRKVSKCRPAVSNETILATSQEFIFTKYSRTMHNWHFTIGFLINATLLPCFFHPMLPFIHFFVNQFIFLDPYISVNEVLEPFLVEKRAITQIRKQLLGGWKSSKMRTAAYRRRGCHASCLPTHYISFHIFRILVL